MADRHDFMHLVWKLIENVGFVDDEIALEAATKLRPLLEDIEARDVRFSPVKEIGSHRPLCTAKIRVAAGLKTDASQRGAWQRKRLGVPVDQCGHRADFLLNGAPTCRPHAGARALEILLEKN